MADPDDPDFAPTRQWTGSDEAAPAPAARLSDQTIEGMHCANSPATRGAWQPPAAEELQARLPHYEITELLGRGGMGAVYKGWQKSLERFVAIKILPPGLVGGDVDFAARFKREAKAMAKLKHPGIIPVHDAGETADGLLYFVMDYVEGTDVQKLLAAHGRLPPEEALPIVSRVLDALAYAHQRGIIHRDIKPANIMVDDEGNVLVADFGLARSTTPDSTMLTVSNMAMGTPDFMAPESHLGMDHVDHRADLYAVGVMLYQMLTGKLPRGRFEPVSRAVPGLDKRLDAIVDRTLQNQRDARYSSAIELRSALEPVLTRSMAKRAVVTNRPTTSWKKPLLLTVAAVAVLSTIAALVHFAPWKKDGTTGELRPVVAQISEAEARKLAGVKVPNGGASAPYPAFDAAGLIVYPVGVWTRLWTAEEEAQKTAQKDGDWMLLNGRNLGRGWQNGGSPMLNLGLRIRFRGQRIVEGNFPQVSLRSGKQYGSVNANIIPDGKKLQLRKVEQGAGIPVLGEVFLRDYLRPAPKEYLEEFYAIGSTLIGRINGQTVTATLPTPTDPGAINIMEANNDFLRDVEVINLDGLPEAEALKLAGLGGSAVSPTSPGALSGSDGSPSRPGALGESALPAAATKDAPFVNGLGMKFVPVPITGGPTDKARVLFSVWETRVQDYEAFAKETQREWRKPEFEQGPTHPAVMMTWDDANAFCAWLTGRERKAGRVGAKEEFRLPTDHEWSCAVGLGEKEDAAKIPDEKHQKVRDVYPWGTSWPPPKATASIGGEEIQPMIAAGTFNLRDFVKGYADAYETTAPVGSFPANALGLHDLGGNVWEWCADWVNPAAEEKRKVVRGGAWSSVWNAELFSSTRSHGAPTLIHRTFGFRVVLAPAP